MKQCPVCHTSYADDTLRFCLEDGAELQTDWSTAKTVSSAEPDRQYISDDTLVLPPRTTNFQQPETIVSSPRPGLSKVLIGIIAVLLMAVAGLSAVIFMPNFSARVPTPRPLKPRRRQRPHLHRQLTPAPTNCAASWPS